MHSASRPVALQHTPTRCSCLTCPTPILMTRPTQVAYTFLQRSAGCAQTRQRRCACHGMRLGRTCYLCVVIYLVKSVTYELAPDRRCRCRRCSYAKLARKNQACFSASPMSDLSVGLVPVGLVRSSGLIRSGFKPRFIHRGRLAASQ